MRILVLGATGLLGSTLVPVLRSTGHTVIAHGRRLSLDIVNADLTRASETSALLQSVEPDVVVNLVGLTDVDRCQAEPQKAFLGNVRTVQVLADCLARLSRNVHLVHISTDHVYDGLGSHTEQDVVLTNVYAFSKFAGELTLARTNSTVVRTNFFGRSQCPGRVSLTDWLYRSMTHWTPIQVFDDVAFNPLSMRTLSRLLEIIIRERPSGVYNLGASDYMTKADFAYRFAAVLGLSTQEVRRVRSDEVSISKAYRPKNMTMDCSRLETILNLRLPSIVDEIEQAAHEYTTNP